MKILVQRGIMEIIATLLFVLMVVQAAPHHDVLSWERFKTEFKKTYASGLENKFRMKTFTRHKQNIVEHNKQFRRGRVSYSLKTNEYSDMPRQDFMRTIHGYNLSSTKYEGIYRRSAFMAPSNGELPQEVDWRANGAVTEVKNQYSSQYCSSCWAFSATGALEGQYYRKTGKLVSLSEQNLIDCSGTGTHGTNGCNGGLMKDAFKYIRENGGINTEDDYPYQGEQLQCRYDPKHSATTLVDIVDVPSGDEQQLMAAVAQVGPVAVAVDASQATFQSYSQGVYYDPMCSSAHLNHAMLVMGYGTDARGGDYWLVKNSWGSSWGMHGYMKLARNRDNHCGIASAASYPII